MKFRFKPFQSSTGSTDPSTSNPSDPQAKRKDQIRRAQRTHRERKEAYTKSLESEVIQLRANEARILQETKALYSEITALKRLLKRNGIPIHSAGCQPHEDAQEENTSDEHPFHLSIRDASAKHGLDHQRINVQRSYENHPNRLCGPTTAALGHQRSAVHVEPTSNSEYPPVAFHQMPAIELGRSTATLSQLDRTTVGMDFVLTLESPCLSHNIPSHPNSTTGHALTVSATLLHQHPTPLEHRLRASHQIAWEVPAAGIEQLLKLSDNVPLSQDELTPVQAWSKVCQHPEFGALEVTRLEGLKKALLKGVKCHGFGGVIDQVTFEDAVFDCFVVGRVF